MFNLSLVRNETHDRSIAHLAAGVMKELKKVGYHETLVRTCIMEYLVPMFAYINRPQCTITSNDTMLKGRLIVHANDILMYENTAGNLVVRNLKTEVEISMPLPQGETFANKMLMKGEHLITVTANSQTLAHYQHNQEKWILFEKQAIAAGTVTTLTSDALGYFYFTSLRNGSVWANRYDPKSKTFLSWNTNTHHTNPACDFHTLGNGNVMYSWKQSSSSFSYDLKTRRVIVKNLDTSSTLKSTTSSECYIYVNDVMFSIFSLNEGQLLSRITPQESHNLVNAMGNGDYLAHHFQNGTNGDLIEVYHLFDLEPLGTFTSDQGRTVSYELISSAKKYTCAFTGNTLHFVVNGEQQIHLSSFDLAQQSTRQGGKRKSPLPELNNKKFASSSSSSSSSSPQNK